MGRSRPSLWRRSSTSLPYAFSSSMSWTASPGSSLGRVKTMSEAITSEGIATTRRLRRYRLSTGSAVEPGRLEATAVVVAHIRSVVLHGRIPDRGLGHGRQLNVVLLPGQVPLDLVDDLAALGEVLGMALANEHIRHDRIVDVALILELAGEVLAVEKIVRLLKARLRAQGHRVELAVEGRGDVRTVLLLVQLGVDADVLEIRENDLGGI